MATLKLYYLSCVVIFHINGILPYFAFLGGRIIRVVLRALHTQRERYGRPEMQSLVIFLLLYTFNAAKIP